MIVLPEHIIDHINDFRFGNVNDWKNLFKRTVNELDDDIYYFKDVYQHVHYLDINNSDEYINYFTISILKSVKYQRRIKNLYKEANIEYDSDSESSVSSVDWSPFGNW